jgi:hypothetical protein
MQEAVESMFGMSYASWQEETAPAKHTSTELSSVAADCEERGIARS